MKSFRAQDLSISLEQEGSREYLKVSYPVRYGRYHQITAGDYIYQFNLRGEIRHLYALGPDWPANEWLKRTEAGDWVYYSNDGYTSVFSLLGEYYLPCFSYKKNGVVAVDPFTTAPVRRAMDSLGGLREKAGRLLKDPLPADLRTFLQRVAGNPGEESPGRSAGLHDMIGGPVTVLPPDTRHVDYDVIPVVIADGCLYNCGFCTVKSGESFTARSRDDILQQIERLGEFYGPDLVNYNSLFLGQHDALEAGADLIEFASGAAYERLRLERSFMRGANLFFFGSVDSFLSSPDDLFRRLDRSPFRTYVNLGLESADQRSLDELEKPIAVDRVREAFRRMLDLNRRLEHLEITANFVLGPSLPESHLDSIVELAGEGVEAVSHKSTLYISPLENGEVVPEIRRSVYRIKNRCRVPVFLYLIQRL
jgi:hypothetical protein